MEKNRFAEAMTALLQKDRIDDCIKCMKYLHMNISIDSAKLILKSAHKYMNVVGDLPFPKEIGGTMYESVGDYVIGRLTEEQVKAITNSHYTHFTIPD